MSAPLIRRTWATPLVTGAFVLIAVTGVLMFFHADSGLNKLAHEWLGWAMLAGAAAHATANWPALRNHLRQPLGRGLVAAFVLALGLSFWPAAGSGDGPPFAAPVAALAKAPLPVLAQVAGVSPEAMAARLQAAGVAGAAGQASLVSLGVTDLKRQLGVLRRVLATPAGDGGGGG